MEAGGLWVPEMKMPPTAPRAPQEQDEGVAGMKSSKMPQTASKREVEGGGGACAWVLWGLGVGMQDRVAPLGQGDGLCFPSWEWDRIQLVPKSPPVMFHLPGDTQLWGLRETCPLMGTNNIDHPASGPDPAL